MAKMDIDYLDGQVKHLYDVMTDELQGSLEAQFSDMDSAIEGLNGIWEGPNHDAFVKDYVARREGIAAFHKLMYAFLEAWDDARRAYAQCEQTVEGYVNACR